MPVVLKGEPAGVKQQGGILEQMLREVEVECLPGDIPSHIDADVSELVFGKVLRVADLPHGDKVEFLTDENQPVAHVISVKEEVVPTPEAVAAEAAARLPSPRSSRRASRRPRKKARLPAAEKAEKAEKKEKK